MGVARHRPIDAQIEQLADARSSHARQEAEVVMKGQQRVPELLDMNAELDRQLAATKTRQSRNHVMGVLTAIIGEKAGVRDDSPSNPPR